MKRLLYLAIVCVTTGCAATTIRGDCHIKQTRITEIACEGKDTQYDGILVFPQHEHE